MPLLFKKDIGRSMGDLSHIEQEEDEKFKESKGLLRRAFSSRKKKKKPPSSPNVGTTPDFLTVPTGRPMGGGGGGIKQPLRAVRSNPNPGSYLFPDSPASDLAARRGVFSRRHYGSVELLISTDPDDQTVGRFRVETGERDGEEVSSPMTTPVHIENPEFQTRWYFKYFLGKMHQNYVGCDSEKEPFLLSVVVTDANNHNVPQYRAIMWQKTGPRKICLPYNPNKPMTVKGILCHLDLEKLERGPKEIFSPEIQKELLLLEEQEGSVNFKFGVIYAKDGQTSDDEMYSNEQGSEAFQEFVSILGDRVRLKGWEKFRGGLDVTSDTTGTDTVYTVYEGHEIMFHISTMLPYSKDNKQQVERKRHIGNDIVNIVFLDTDTNKSPSFKPSMMKTHFTHIYSVVTHNPENDSYKLISYSEESVPLFGPPLPTPPVFTDHCDFRDFLLVKLINGEKAAFNTPVFAQKRQRTLDMLIKNLYQDYMPESNKNNMLNRRAFSDLIPDNVYGSRRKEEARQVEFLRIGQSLKLKTILRGDAPTSLVSSGALLKHQPWEPQCFLHDFQYEIICGDSWGDKLVVSTSSGTFVLEEGSMPRMIFDKSVAVKQLSIVEAHGLMVFRTDKGKDGRIIVFRLVDFEGELNESVVRTKQDMRDHKIERSKGCHLYQLSRPGGSHLRLVAAVSKRLQIHMWKHSSAWTAWCNVPDTDAADGFQFLRELQASEVPQLITLVDGVGGDNQICIGSKNQFELINEKNGDTLQLYQVDASKVSLVSAIDIYEEEEAELLLCYNHVSHFQKMSEEQSHEFDFQWNSQPDAIVCAFPYIMAFTPDTIEIRLLINGSLVHTMTMPNISLVTSKYDIYFVSTASDNCGLSPFEKTKDASNTTFQFSPPPSPCSSTGDVPMYTVYKISLMCLAGQITVEKPVVPPPSPQPQPQTLLSPLVSSDSRPRSPTGKRSPLLRTKRNICVPADDVKHRHDSNSSSCDSGIHVSRRSDVGSPQMSPRPSLSASLEEEEDVL